MHTRQRLSQLMAQEAIMGTENLGFAHDTENSGYSRGQVFAFRRKRHIRTVIRSCSSGGIDIIILWVNNPQKGRVGREYSTIYLNEKPRNSIIKRIHIEHDAKSGLIESRSINPKKRPAAIKTSRKIR